MNRRSFLTKTGLLLGGLGVNETFKLDLMEKLARQLLPFAHAQGADAPPRRTIELCFRAGIPMTIFAQGKAFNSTDNLYSNFNYPNNSTARPMPNGATARNIVYNIDSAPLLEYADYIAITQGIVVNPLHTNMFDYREGGPGAGKPSPAVELANANSTQSIVHGVIFPLSGNGGNDVRNSTGGLRDLEKTNNATEFKALFKNPVLRLTAYEVNTVLKAAEKLSRRQALLLDTKLSEATKHVNAHASAVKLFERDLTAELNVQNTMSSFFQRDIQTSASGGQSNRARESLTAVRENLALVLKAFQLNLINSAVITVDVEDWHGYRDGRHQGAIARDMSEMLRAAIRFMQTTPDPAAPELKLWDTTVIVAGSEFARGISAAYGAGDNPDSGTQSFMMIGKNVRGDYYGNFKLGQRGAYGGEVAVGFDPQTGVAYSIESRKRNTAEQAYHTIRAACGLKLSTTEKEKALKAMLRV